MLVGGREGVIVTSATGVCHCYCWSLSHPEIPREGQHCTGGFTLLSSQFWLQLQLVQVQVLNVCQCRQSVSVSQYQYNNCLNE